MRLIVAAAAAAGGWALVAPARAVVVPMPGARAVLAGLLGALAAALFGAPSIATGAIGLGAAVVPGMLTRASAERDALAARNRWPDFLAVVRSRIGSGEPLPDAVRAAARSLGGPFLDLDLAWGGSFVPELEAARARWRDPVADRVLTTLRVAATTGGTHVDTVLSTLATSLSDEMQIRAAHDAALTQQRLTAAVALVAPWAILALSLVTNPQTSGEFSTPTGRLILAGGVVATVAGYVLARRAAALARPPRVFA